MRPSSIVAVVVSAVVGVALGVGAGLALDGDGHAFADPLRIGAPYVNQPCTHKVLLTVDRGPDGAKITTGVTENSDQHVSYLDTSKSCRTAWNPRNSQAPRYVAYRGPFDTRQEACNAQFSAGHPGGVVTTLTAGSTDTVACLCFVSLPRPRMHLDMSVEGTNGIWIRQLQGLLVDLGLGTEDDISGSYDLTTAAKIRDFQRANKRPATGEVDADTWHFLQQAACNL